MNKEAKVGSECSTDYLAIEGSNSFGANMVMSPLVNLYCGGFLSDTTGAIANNVIRGDEAISSGWPCKETMYLIDFRLHSTISSLLCH